MKTLRYTIALLSDAEPGSGLGTELINDLVPRDHYGNPNLPASHIKGLVRESLSEIVALRGWGPEWLDYLLGTEGGSVDDGTQSAVRFSSVKVRGETPSTVRLVTRTAIDAETGVVHPRSLRTSEYLAVATELFGSVSIGAAAGETGELLLRLALCSLPSIGGNRRRGAGRCAIRFDDRAAERPSQLLKQLEQALSRQPHPLERATASTNVTMDLGTVMVQLEFLAQDPVCCPEVPLTSTNVLRGGFMIPASAVQGALLDRLNAHDPNLATQTYEHSGFRAWPLLPACPTGRPRVGFPIWTSLTHRMSKLAALGPAADKPVFADEMVEPRTAEDVARAAGLKAADGVLIRSPDGGVELWRARDMPRHIAAHVSLTEREPRLYTVESLAPLVFRGIVMLPRAAWSLLERLLKENDQVSFGKSRSTLGGGRLGASLLDTASHDFLAAPAQVFVVQSPLLIEGDHKAIADGHAGDVLTRMVESSGFGKVERAEASLGLRFGWNRHKLGVRTGARNRLQAARVVLPGSVFRLCEPCGSDMIELMGKGVGAGRERGYGAILPHPGKAVAQFQDRPEPLTLRSRDQAGRQANSLVAASTRSGLSTSQVAWLSGEILSCPRDIASVIASLKTKSPRSWERWGAVHTALLELAKANLDNLALERALAGWRDGIRGDSREVLS